MKNPLKSEVRIGNIVKWRNPLKSEVRIGNIVGELAVDKTIEQ